jgi:hypothetical protein
MTVGPHQRERAEKVELRAATPVAGAVAGILFAVLFGVSVSIISRTMGDAGHNSGEWLNGDTGTFRFALAVMPFAGLFFLWFIAVSRERLGRHEDQFFATVFLGSGLLFLAMLFAASASGGALVITASRAGSEFSSSDTYVYGRLLIAQIFSIYALRMAAVFQISLATLWMRTGVMPRWMALVTYVTALVLLFIFTQSQWVILVFPAWVSMVSVYILVMTLRRRAAGESADMGAGEGPDVRAATPSPGAGAEA